MARGAYYHDANAPTLNSLAPSAFAVVRDAAGRVLLVRRADNGVWELPGGRVDLGESATTAAVREVAEEAGVTVEVTRLAGVSTDPGHIIVHAATGEIRQKFVVCFHALPLGGEPYPDDHETCEAAWIPTDRLETLDIHPTMRRRVTDALGEPRSRTSVENPGLPDTGLRRPGCPRTDTARIDIASEISRDLRLRR